MRDSRASRHTNAIPKKPTKDIYGERCRYERWLQVLPIAAQLHCGCHSMRVTLWLCKYIHNAHLLRKMLRHIHIYYYRTLRERQSVMFVHRYCRYRRKLPHRSVDNWDARRQLWKLKAHTHPSAILKYNRIYCTHFRALLAPVRIFYCNGSAF